MLHKSHAFGYSAVQISTTYYLVMLCICGSPHVRILSPNLERYRIIDVGDTSPTTFLRQSFPADHQPLWILSAQEKKIEIAILSALALGYQK